jgi:hypothetical protein
MENGIIEDSEMGSIDHLVIEWPGRQPTGEAMPYLIDLVGPQRLMAGAA